MVYILSMSQLIQELPESWDEGPPYTYIDDVGREVALIDKFSLPLQEVKNTHADNIITEDGTSTYISVALPDTETNFRNPMYFNFNSGRLLGNGVITANESSRFRGVLGALTVEAAEYQDMTVEKATQRINTLKSFLSSKVTINKVEKRKDQFVNIEEVFKQLETELSAEYEPAWQAIQQLKHEYSQLGPGILNLIKRSVFYAIHAERIKRIYSSKIDAAKKPSKDKPA